MIEAWSRDEVVAHSVALVRSFRVRCGRELLAEEADERELARKLFYLPGVVVAHGTQADPILCYGNAAALRLWEVDWEVFTQMPSRLTAEAPRREERARLLAAVTSKGYIDDYAGIRISATGRRFEIAQATVWNVADAGGAAAGLAATFSRWSWIPA